MGRLHLVLLDGDAYTCKFCRTQLALRMDIFSKVHVAIFVVTDVNPMEFFQCRHGKAYLFTNVVNVTHGQKQERLMTTGMHTVADIFCVGCGSILGWKYETAHVKTQKYKEGMFILERDRVLGPNGTTYCESDDTQDDEGDAGEGSDSLNLP